MKSKSLTVLWSTRQLQNLRLVKTAKSKKANTNYGVIKGTPFNSMLIFISLYTFKNLILNKIMTSKLQFPTLLPNRITIQQSYPQGRKEKGLSQLNLVHSQMLLKRKEKAWQINIELSYPQSVDTNKSNNLILFIQTWTQQDVKLKGVVNFLPEISNRTEEQTEKLFECPIGLSESVPE